IAPAVRAWRLELLPWLKAGEQGIVQGRSRLSSTFVIVQLAFSVVLLTSAGLAYRSLSLVDALDLGFNKANIVLVTVNTAPRTAMRPANIALLNRLRDRLRSVRRVEAVSYARCAPPAFWSRVPDRGGDSQLSLVAV